MTLRAMEIQLHFSDHHLITAVITADQARKIESNHETGSGSAGHYSDIPVHVEHNAMVASSIISSFAYLEGFANETHDTLRNQPEVRRVFLAINELSSTDFTQYQTLSKFQTMLTAAGCDPFSRGEAPFQEVEWVRKLRNYLIHYEPDIVTNEGENETNLENALRDRVDPNPLYAHEDETYLPRLALSYNCCEWAIRSVIDFNTEFRARIGDKREMPHLEVVEEILD